jgi:integrase/recombinase XerD
MGKRLTADRILSRQQLKALLREMEREKDAALAASGGNPKFVVDYYLTAVAAATGLRISEVAALTFGDIHDGFLVVQRGKGGKKRDVVFGPKTKRLFSEYLAHYVKYFGPAEPDRRLWIGKRGALTRSGIHQRWLYWKKRVGLPNAVTFHSLRHGALTWLLDNAVPLQAVRDFAGHASASTTSVYLHFTAEAQAKLKAVL